MTTTRLQHERTVISIMCGKAKCIEENIFHKYLYRKEYRFIFPHDQ